MSAPRQKEPDLISGVAAGLAGGLLASFLMEQFQALWSGVTNRFRTGADEQSGELAEPATVKAANALSVRLQGRELPERSRPLAAEVVHYTMGAVSGGIYGGLVEMFPVAEKGEGVGFGAALWLLADELAVPALKLSGPPGRIPLRTHLYALASHVVYGWVTEQVRSGFRTAL